ncbi:MAG: alpha/beta hydrolase [Gammaproteobacteria bacterium]|nr:alpha/beta hydrolase [Gammaproteobacteria bacterium]
MQRAYANLNDCGEPWQIHYREHGTGSALVMLHPSPLSSVFLEPQIALFGEFMHCIAWDTPGYGFSDPLPSRFDSDRSLKPYIEALLCFLDCLGLERPIIYGSATGAQIAIAFAGAYPQHCAGLLLENVALFEGSEVEELLNGYFPDLNAKEDGSHLFQLWEMATQSTCFFPWYDTRPEARRNNNPPPAPVLNAIVRDHMLAGSSYDRAYQAAFANERLEPLQGLTMPTRIILWSDGLLGDYGERVTSAPLPANVQVQRAVSGMNSRLNSLQKAAVELLAVDD